MVCVQSRRHETDRLLSQSKVCLIRTQMIVHKEDFLRQRLEHPNCSTSTDACTRLSESTIATICQK